MQQRRVSVSLLDGVPTLYIDERPWPNIILEPWSIASKLSLSGLANEAIFLLPCALGTAPRLIAPTSEQGLGTGVAYSGNLWCGLNLLDVTDLYAQLTDIVINVPNALILLQVNVDVPSWWVDYYPNELSLSHDGNLGLQSMSSLIWRHQVGRKLRRLIEMLAEGPFARYVIGFHLTTRWHRSRFQPPLGFDYSQASLGGFRRWLHGRYASDAALQDAWGLPHVTRDTAQFPTDVADAESNNGQAHPWFLDAQHYHAWIAADSGSWFCGLVKRISEGSGLVGISCVGSSLRSIDRGHQYWKKRLLASPDIDFIVGTSACSSGTEDSCCNLGSVHGKLWFADPFARSGSEAV